MNVCDKCQGCRHKYEPRTTGGLPPISSLFLGVTGDCTHRCRYCFVSHNPEEMTYEMAFRGLMWLSRQTAPNQRQQNQNLLLTYFGGEPMMKWDDIIVPLTITAKGLFKQRINFGITTNGYLLNPERIEFMKKYNMSPLLSFDGVRECQDTNRPLANGKGTFDKTYPNIKPLLTAFPNITMRMTVYHKTVHLLYENHRFAIENGFKATFAAIDTYGEWTEEEYQTYENELYRVADLFISLVKEGKWVEFNPLIRDARKLRITRGEIPPRAIKKPLTGKCGIGSNNSVLLAPDGKFYTCQETYTIPEVKEYFYAGDIETGVDNERRLAIINDLDQSKFRCVNPALCETCPYKGHCEGGCSARNYEHNRDLNLLPEATCRDEQIRYKVISYIDERLKDNQLYQAQTKPKQSCNGIKLG